MKKSSNRKYAIAAIIIAFLMVFGMILPYIANFR
jgi:hypothetical protein